jgi:predicted nucleotidyltransferase
MKNRVLSDTDKEKIVAILRENGAVVGYLFGSYVRGTAGPLSDLDVGVVFKDTLTEGQQEDGVEKIRFELEVIYGKDNVDVVNILLLRNPLLQYVITLGEGQVLFCDDRAALNSIALKALRDFEDTRSLRKIQREALSGLFINK